MNKKLLIITIFLFSLLLLSACQKPVEKTGATNSCCDIGCLTSLSCKDFASTTGCPSLYKYEPTVDQCVKNTGLQSLGQLCFPDKKSLCKDAFWNDGYFYCDIDNVVSCPNGCLNGLCQGTVPIPDCSEGSTQCGLTIKNEPSADPYKCTGGKLVQTDTCTNDEYCTFDFGDAKCFSGWKYCLNDNRECIKCSSNFPNTYDTSEQCRSNVPFWCLSTDKTSCTRRLGGCVYGEMPSSGSTEATVKASCENDICGKFEEH